MKISKLIRILSVLGDKHGDLEIFKENHESITVAEAERPEPGKLPAEWNMPNIFVVLK